MVTLKPKLGVTQVHWQWHHSIDRIRIGIRRSLQFVNMSLSSTVTEIISVDYWRDREIWVMDRSRSLKMVAIDDR